MAFVGKVFLTALPLGLGFRHGATKQQQPTAQLEDMMTLDEQVRVLEGLQKVGEQFSTVIAVNGSRDRADGYDASADFIMEYIKSLSPSLNPVQEFYDDLMWRNTAPPTLSSEGQALKFGTDFRIMTFSGNGLVEGTASGLSGNANGCSPQDWAGFPAGRPAIVARGSCTFCLKAYNAKQAGASAFLLHYLQGQSLGAPRLNCNWGTPDFPALSTTYEVGQSLLASTAVRAESFGENLYRQSSNVILDFPGGDPDFVVLLGAHLDSVPDTPGINDNGSGCALILEILRNVARKYLDGGLTNGIRFGFFGSEEWGLIGSRKYVAKLTPEEKLRIAGMLNFDMMASQNGGFFINKGSMDPTTPTASGHIQRLFEKAFDSMNVPWEWSGLGGSDYASFLEVGIPAGGILTGASSAKSAAMAAKFGGVAGAPYAPCYHKPCDVWADFDRQRLFTMSKATAQVTETMLTDPELHVNMARENPFARSFPASDEGVVEEAEHKDDEDYDLM